MLNRFEANWTEIAAHVVNSMPDSLTDRHKILKAVAELIPTDHPARADVTNLLTALNVHMTHEREAQLRLNLTPQPRRTTR